MAITNVDLFRAFAADTDSHYTLESYYFEHSRLDLDFSNLKEPSTPGSTLVHIFHYTTSFAPRITGTNGVDAMVYRGEVIVLVKSQVDEVIDVQRGTTVAAGRYTKHVKPLIESGGIMAEIMSFMACDPTYEHTITISPGVEIYGMFDANMDGISFSYELTVKQ